MKSRGIRRFPTQSPTSVLRRSFPAHVVTVESRRTLQRSTQKWRLSITVHLRRSTQSQRLCPSSLSSRLRPSVSVVTVPRIVILPVLAMMRWVSRGWRVRRRAESHGGWSSAQACPRATVVGAAHRLAREPQIQNFPRPRGVLSLAWGIIAGSIIARGVLSLAWSRNIIGSRGSGILSLARNIIARVIADYYLPRHHHHHHQGAPI